VFTFEARGEDLAPAPRAEKEEYNIKKKRRRG
jgi:hypothetical protein